MACGVGLALTSAATAFVPGSSNAWSPARPLEQRATGTAAPQHVTQTGYNQATDKTQVLASGAALGALASAAGSRRRNRRQAKASVASTASVVARPALPDGGYCPAAEKTVRRKTRTVMVGSVPVGSDHPVATQTMTTTLTDDVEGTVAQIKKCADMGIDIVRITVQGIREAKACEGIKKRLLEDGYTTPIVADIHFTPKVALVCAEFVDKVRVNPGNFADGRKSFDTIKGLTDEDIKEAQEDIEAALVPLVLKLKEQNKSMRIGVNHGSLAERILFQYGDSPEGMVASAIEFGEICRKHDFHNFIFSMKSSNPQVMVNAYRALARKMYELGWDYPLHLGVTEAGGGADGRIKSAVGIGALLLDGLGDTIRVSLTEDPEYEAAPCKSLRAVGQAAQGNGVDETFEETNGRREGQKARRKCEFPLDIPLNQDGTVLATVSAGVLKHMDTKAICERFDLTLRADMDVQKAFKSVDVVVVEGMVAPDVGVKIKQLLDIPLGVICKGGPNVPAGATIMVEASKAEECEERLGGYALLCTGKESAAEMKAALEKVKPRMILLRPESQDGVTFVGRRFMSQLTSIPAGEAVPVMYWFRYQKDDNKDEDDLVIQASSEFGSLFVDGLGEGMLWDAGEALTPSYLIESSFNLLQASRMRISKTEFISCPSCGRTLFSLQETTAKIQARTGHLPGVRIAVMGCIVNGPGEMADADFGYVGSGVGKVDLYVGYDCVQRAIPSEKAVDRLVELIRDEGKWQDPPEDGEVSSDEVNAVAVL